MSFPAILRAPGLSDRFAHLRSGLSRSESATAPVSSAKKNNRRDEKAGKRWVRRKDNGMYPLNLLGRTPRFVDAIFWNYVLWLRNSSVRGEPAHRRCVVEGLGIARPEHPRDVPRTPPRVLIAQRRSARRKPHRARAALCECRSVLYELERDAEGA